MEKSAQIRTWLLGSFEAAKRFAITTFNLLARITQVLFVGLVIFIIVLIVVSRTTPPADCKEGYVWFSSVSGCIPGYVPTKEPTDGPTS